MLATNKDYAFPISLQDVYTADGKTMPRLKAVVRTDRNEPIAHVSGKYRLVEHQLVVDAAEKFMEVFGKPETTFSVESRGARLAASYVFNQHQMQVGLNDPVALTLYIENSYNATRSIVMRVGAKVLTCLNGMVSSRSLFNFFVKHISNQPLVFPNPDLVFKTFQLEGNKWNNFTTRSLSAEEYKVAALNAYEQNIVPEGAAKFVADEYKEGATVWDLLQNFTYHTTHETKRMGEIGRVARLERVSRYFDEVFGGPYAPSIATS